MGRFRGFLIRLGAPLMLVLGIPLVLVARRGMALKQSLALWKDSLDHGSGPLAISVPLVPAYLDGQRIGSLDSVWLERHEPRSLDSLRLVIDLSQRAAADEAIRSCAFKLVTFDPEEFKHALQCAADTAGLVPFGRVAFAQGGDARLYVNAEELSCAPWTQAKDSNCVGVHVQRQVEREIQRVRDRTRQRVRVRMR